VLDALLNWILDVVEAGLDLLPSWSPNLPALDAWSTPLSQINWLIAIDMPMGLALTMLLLGPAFLMTTMILWVVGLFTPTATTR